jgi:hypothetical protein
MMRQLDNLVQTQQQTAIILERLSARLDALEKWQESQTRQQERAIERREDTIEHHPDQLRANVALALSGCSALVYLLWFIGQHWR